MRPFYQALSISSILFLFTFSNNVISRDNAIENEVTALYALTLKLEGASAVKKLQRAYGYYLDKGYWNDAVDLFTADARFESGIDGVYVGKQRLLDYLIQKNGGNSGPGLPFGQYNRRMQLQPVVTVAEDGITAKARWREFSLTGQWQENQFWGDGIYENGYVKESGIWKIDSMHFYPNFLAPYKGGWAKLANAANDWRSETAKVFPADSVPTVVYQPYPAAFTPPYHYPNPAVVARLPELPPATSSKLRTELDEYRSMLSRTQSMLAIENLQGAWGYYFDKGRWDDVVALFSQDATWEWGHQGVYVGANRIRQALTLIGPNNLKKGQLNNYMMIQPIITIAHDNLTAKARWRSDVNLAIDGKGYWGEGVYENEYVNDSGVWKISKLHWFPTVQAEYEAGLLAGAITLPGPSKKLPPDRPPSIIYKSIPEEAPFTDFHYPNLGQGHVETTAGSRLLNAPTADNSITHSIQNLGRLITRLADEAAIEKLQASYGYYVDSAKGSEAAKLFTEEGSSIEVGLEGVFVNAQGIGNYLAGPVMPSPPPGVTPPPMIGFAKHQQLQPLVNIAADGKTAKARTSAFMMEAFQMPGAPEPLIMWGTCLYENEYVKENGVWKLKKLFAPFDMWTNYKKGWAMHVEPVPTPEWFPPYPDLPPSYFYLKYPNFMFIPYHYPNPVTGVASPAPHPHAGGMKSMLKNVTK